jgi:copper transport protein
MTMPTGPRTRALTLLAGLMIGLAGFFLIPAGAAQAHAALISTNPVAGSILPINQPPSMIVITFSEHVGPEAGKISVIGPDRKRIDNGLPVSVGDQLRIPVDKNVAGGTYLVSYRVISADSHPVAGGFYYSVGSPSAGGAPKPLDDTGTDPVVSTAVSVMQFVGFAGLCLIVGPALVLIALWPRRLDRTGPTRLAYAGIGLVGLATLAGIYLQGPYATGNGIFDVSGSGIADVLDTSFGRAMMVRLAALVVCALLLRPVLAGNGAKSDRILLGTIGTIGVATWAFAGHPAASSVPPLTIIADVAHLISVSIWIGGLVMLLAYLLRRANVRELGAILPVWSNWATLAITVLVLGGTAQALIQIGSFDALFHTTYGQLILVKVGILAAIMVFAAGARRLVQKYAVIPETIPEPVAVGAGSAPMLIATDAGPGTDGGTDDGGDYDEDGDDYDDDDDDDEEPDDEPVGMYEPQVKRLRRSVFAELALAVVVLVASSILVQSSPALNAAALTADGGGSVTLTAPHYRMQVDFTADQGATDIHMFFYNAAGGPQPVQKVTIVATIPSQNLTQDVQATSISDAHWTATAILPPGTWTFTFTVQTSAIDEDTVHVDQHIG